MNFEKLTPKDFTHKQEKYFYSYNERGSSSDGENIHAHYYDTRCKVFGVNVPLILTFRNPQESFEESLPKVKQNLKWLEDNRKKILSTMAAQRNADDFYRHMFNSDQTRKMDDQKFMNFLILREIRMIEDYSITLKFNEFDNIPGSYFAFDISSDKRKQSIFVQGF